MSYQWAQRALEPCYAVVYTFRQVVEHFAGEDGTQHLNNPMLDLIFVGVNDDEIGDPPPRHIVNFRTHSWLLSNKKDKIPISDVDHFLENPVFDQVDELIGGNQLLHILQHGSWFDILVEEHAIVQRIGDRLDHVISDPAFVFRPRTKLPSAELLEKPIFDFAYSSRKKKKRVSNESSRIIDRKTLMYSRVMAFKGKIRDNSETKSQFQSAVMTEIDQIFSFAAYTRLASNEGFKKIMEEVKVNHGRCRLKSLVDKFCPITYSTKNHDMVKLLKDVQSHKNVCELMRSIFFFVFPKNLFGSCGNRTKVYRSMKLIVTTGFHVQLQARNLIRKIDLKSVSWLSILPKEWRRKTFEEFSVWVCNYLVSCLRSYFYVTETKFDKSKLHFYRNETWKRICDLEMGRQMKEKVLAPLTSTSQEMYNSGFCSSGARFVPKMDSVRMINRLYKPPDSFGIYSRELKGLRSLLHLLKNDDQKYVLNHNKFPEVIRSIKESQAGDPNANLYFIRADIKHCYPSIKHDVLVNIIETRMAKVFGSIPSSIVIQLYNFLSVKNFKIQRRPEFTVKDQRVRREIPVMKNTITVPGESFELKNPLIKIKIYVDDAIIKFGTKMYRMKQGIRQGALLSADLCTLYMESFVNESFKSLLQLDEDYLLLEADDLIILTDSRERAQSYLEILLKGSQEYNMVLNLDKLRFNFLHPNFEGANNISNEVIFFSHCFNTYSQELTIDFTSYIDKEIKFSFACNPFVSFEKTRKRLIRQLTFNPEIMDRRINSKETLMRNLFERLHLQAFRLAAFVLSLKEHKITFDTSDVYNFIVGTVQKVSKLNKFWSCVISTDLTEEEISLACICAVRQVWIKRLKSRNSDVDRMNGMIKTLFAQSSQLNHLRKWLQNFEEYPKKPFDKIILS